MTIPTAKKRAPLTFEDMLLLLVRRLLIPVALAEMLFGGFIGLLLVVSGTPIYAEGLALLLIPAAMVAIGLIFVGIPAGYAVARLGWGIQTQPCASRDDRLLRHRTTGGTPSRHAHRAVRTVRRDHRGDLDAGQ